MNGRDELSIANKVELDVEYLNRQSFWFDMKVLWYFLLIFTNVPRMYPVYKCIFVMYSVYKEFLE